MSKPCICLLHGKGLVYREICRSTFSYGRSLLCINFLALELPSLFHFGFSTKHKLWTYAPPNKNIVATLPLRINGTEAPPLRGWKHDPYITCRQAQHPYEPFENERTAIHYFRGSSYSPGNVGTFVPGPTVPTLSQLRFLQSLHSKPFMQEARELYAHTP
jgi:hypothetical protein